MTFICRKLGLNSFRHCKDFQKWYSSTLARWTSISQMSRPTSELQDTLQREISCKYKKTFCERYPLGGVRCLGGRGRNYGGVTFSINWRPPLGEKQSRLETSLRRREREIETALLLARKAMLVLVTQGSAKFKFLGCGSVAGSFWQRW